MHALRIRRVYLVACMVITWLIVLIGTLGAQPALAATSFGQPVPGQRVYDRTGLLTASERADLEAHAAAVARAGAPVVVYLQARDASYDETEQDARDLMNAWDVQSSAGAHDGLVLFFNLKPNDLRHGQAAFYAGKTQIDGNLPTYALQRIYDDEMLPLLKSGQTAAGIAAGLDAVAHVLVAGPPPPPEPTRFERIATELTRGPLSVVSLAGIILAAGAALTSASVSRQRPAKRGGVPTTVPPDERPPAEVGALVGGKIDDRQIEATMLDLARRGALSVEPVGKKKVQVRLHDQSFVQASSSRPFGRACSPTPTLTTSSRARNSVRSARTGRPRATRCVKIWKGAASSTRTRASAASRSGSSASSRSCSAGPFSS